MKGLLYKFVERSLQCICDMKVYFKSLNLQLYKLILRTLDVQRFLKEALISFKSTIGFIVFLLRFTIHINFISYMYMYFMFYYFNCCPVKRPLLAK